MGPTTTGGGVTDCDDRDCRATSTSCELAPQLDRTVPATVTILTCSLTSSHALDQLVAIYAMAGGTEEHSALSAEVLRLLGNAVGQRPCRVHTSDLRIYVEAVGLATFPDASVIRGPLEQHTASPKTTALNPLVLVEVTSDSSEEYDTVDKLAFYKTIPTLHDYIIVSHRERRLVVHSRAQGEWQTRTAIPGGDVQVPSLGAELSVEDVYRASSIR